MNDYKLHIGIAAGACTGVAMLPQLYKIIKQKKAEQISIGMIIILLSGLVLWIFYGLISKDYPIIITNSFSALVNLLIIYYSVRYKRNR